MENRRKIGIIVTTLVAMVFLQFGFVDQATADLLLSLLWE